MRFLTCSSHGVLAIAVSNLLGSTIQVTEATLAAPFAFEMQNEDGTSTGPVKLVGGPGEHYFETESGWTICDGTSGDRQSWYYCDATGDGDLVPRLDLPVGSSNPESSGIRKGMKKSKAKAAADCGDFCLFPPTDGRGKKGSKKSTKRGRAMKSNASLNRNTKRKAIRGDKQSDGSVSSHGDETLNQPVPRELQASGVLKNLVVIFKFSDHANRNLPSKADIDILMNSPTPVAGLAPTGSVKQVFLDNSGGDLILDSTVADWVTLDSRFTEEYCATDQNTGKGESGLTTSFHDCLKNALDKVDQFINFNGFNVDGSNSKIDAITFLHSGYGAEWGGNGSSRRIWSHRWGMSRWWSSDGVYVSDYHISPALWSTSGSQIGRIGVIAHETAHFLGLPDLYDYTEPGSGIGSWSLMANSWGFDGSQLYPPQMDPWSKIELGWASLTTLSNDCSANSLLSRTQSLKPSYSNHEYFKIEQGFPTGENDEYLVVENRQAIGYDQKIPREGILIWHIDNKKSSNNNDEGYPGQSGFPENNRHYRVALLQADGDYDLEKGTNSGDAGDVFRASGKSSLGPRSAEGGFPNTDSYQDGNIISTGITIANIQSAGGKHMQFTYQDTCSTDPTPAPVSAPPACQASQFQVVLEVETDQYGSEDNSMTLKSTTTGATIWDEPSFDDNDASSFEACLNSNQCYTLNFDDAYGDGFLNGKAIAWTVDGVVKYNGGDFGDGYVDEKVGSCSVEPLQTPAPVTPAPNSDPTIAPATLAPVPDPTPAPVTPAPVQDPTPAPVTPAPVPNPTPAPITPAPVPDPTPAPVTPAPVPGPTPAPIFATSCGASQMSVRLDVQADQYAIEDNSLTLVSTTTAEIIWSQSTFDNNQDYVFEACLESNECHTLTFDDDYGDGFTDNKKLTWTVDGVVEYDSGDFEEGYINDQIGSCGGSGGTFPTDAPAGSPTGDDWSLVFPVQTFDDGEFGDIFEGNGKEAKIEKDGTLKIKDDKSDSYAVTSHGHTFAPSTQMRLMFKYYSKDFKANDGDSFSIEYSFDDILYETWIEFAFGDSNSVFQENEVWYDAIIPPKDIGAVDEIYLLFRNHGDGGKRAVYIDDIQFEKQ